MRSYPIFLVLLLLHFVLPAFAKDYTKIDVLNAKVSFEYPADWIIDMQDEENITVSNHDEEVVFAEGFSVTSVAVTPEEKDLSLDQFVDASQDNLLKGFTTSDDDSIWVVSRVTEKRNGKDICILKLSALLMEIYRLDISMLLYKNDKEVILGFLTYDPGRLELNGEKFSHIVESFLVK